MGRRVVLITGCSKGGIGHHMCAEFAAKGCKVYAGVRRLSAAQDLEPLGVTLLQLDVLDAHSRQTAVDIVLKEEGRIDILVNNAGIGGPAGPYPELPLDDIKLVYETNVFAPIAMTQLVVPHMLQQKSGQIINISSASAYLTAPCGGAYPGSKSAISSVTNALRLELQPHGIHVMHVPLGCVQTRIQSKVMTTFSSWTSDSPFFPQKEGMIAAAKGIYHFGISPEKFAATLVSAALRKSPPSVLWIGGMWWLPLVMNAFPLWLSDWMFSLTCNLFIWLNLAPPPALPSD